MLERGEPRAVDAIIVADVTGRIIHANDAAAVLLGYGAAELVGLTIEDTYPPDQRDRARERLKRLIGGETLRFDRSFRRKDGSELAAEVAIRRLPNDTFEATCRELTLARVTERTLRLQSAALSAAQDAIIITDRDGAIQWVNPAFERQTGYRAAEAIGRTPQLLKSEHTAPETHEALWATATRGDVWRGELVNRRKDGALYRVELTVTPVRSSDGEISHFVGVSVDVTTARELETRLRLAQRMDAVGRVAGGMAHDFNNMLTTILSFAGLMRMGLPPDSPLREYVDHIDDASRRGADLIRKLLAFGRRQHLELRTVVLSDLVNEFAALARRVLPETVVLSTRIEVGAATAVVDPGAVHQILMNLATNARDAMPSGGRLELLLTEEVVETAPTQEKWRAPGRYLVLTVTDSGTGMTEEARSRIFEPFFTTKGPERGTGLGMAMVYGLVKQHRGFIAVQSELGHGTTVRIWLRKAGNTPGEAPAPPSPDVRGGNETILLVEDEPEVMNAASQVLLAAGYRVHTAADGQEALARLADMPSPDLIVTDLVMPRMGGAQLHTELQRRGTVPLMLFMSGYASGDRRKLMAGQPSLPFLRKPWSREELLRMVRETLDAQRGGR